MLDVLSHAFAAYRILQDSGMWVFQMYSQQATEYLHMYAVNKGWAE